MVRWVEEDYWKGGTTTKVGLDGNGTRSVGVVCESGFQGPRTRTLREVHDFDCELLVEIRGKERFRALLHQSFNQGSDPERSQISLTIGQLSGVLKCCLASSLGSRKMGQIHRSFQSWYMSLYCLLSGIPEFCRLLALPFLSLASRAVSTLCIERSDAKLSLEFKYLHVLLPAFLETGRGVVTSTLGRGIKILGWGAKWEFSKIESVM